MVEQITDKMYMGEPERKKGKYIEVYKGGHHIVLCDTKNHITIISEAVGNAIMITNNKTQCSFKGFWEKGCDCKNFNKGEL